METLLENNIIFIRHCESVANEATGLFGLQAETWDSFQDALLSEYGTLECIG